MAHYYQNQYTPPPETNEYGNPIRQTNNCATPFIRVAPPLYRVGIGYCMTSTITDALTFWKRKFKLIAPPSVTCKREALRNDGDTGVVFGVGTPMLKHFPRVRMLGATQPGRSPWVPGGYVGL
ncbi:hypothetical protein TIFTF001_027790 [Ficus carica]|uniref:Uncharacterized protein n=1 Tax=Ficus carica TaxID=3494 RepID=A0AA88DNV4_FICCA|nr:hypothetical protein TIFTF001_027790 [Ficus carica]